MGQSQFENYDSYVSEQAELFVSEYLDQLTGSIKEGDTDVHTFVSDYTHEWVDNDFIYVDLLDCAHILDQSDNVETDSGLWEGLEPRKAIESQAFFTYRNDLESAIRDAFEEKLMIKKEEIEDELEELEDSLDKLDNEEDEDEIEELENEKEDLESFIYNLEEAIGSL